jgi:hypothetical protein
MEFRILKAVKHLAVVIQSAFSGFVLRAFGGKRTSGYGQACIDPVCFCKRILLSRFY